MAHRRVHRPKILKGKHEKYREKPLQSDVNRQKKAQKALEHRRKCEEQAELVRSGTISVKKAAQECGISERSMGRHVARSTKGRTPCSETTATNSPAQ